MDKLSAQQQQQIRKMSDERLKTQLVDAGYDGEEVESWGREKLMTRLADVMVAGARTKEAQTEEDPEREEEGLEYPYLRP